MKPIKLRKPLIRFSALLLLPLLATIGTAPAHANPTSPTTSSVAIFSDSPLPEQIDSNGISPMSVPSGYTLHGNWIDDYHYRSITGYYGDYHCGSVSCTLNTEVSLQFRETLNGGTSKYWALSAIARTVEGSTPWILTYGYTCGINVAGSPDHTCQYNASPSGTSGSLSPSGTAIWKTFEHRNSGIDYPMFAITVHFNDGAVSTGKFRGWDVCNASYPKLCNETGTGY